MNLDPSQLRLDGIYQQREADRFMQRIKVPAGALSAAQARKVSALADRFAGGRMHLTTRGSIELHNLPADSLAELNRLLAAVGLTGRGACGGAVRGISCSTSFSAHYPACQALARRLHRHFAGNPWFEGLPKKFKIGVEGDPGGRHLIQDVGLVYAGEKDAAPLWDVWCGGGLGRDPQAAFLLGERIREARIIPLIEGILRVYGNHVPAGQRLKHLLRDIGEAEFRALLRAQTGELPSAPAASGLGQVLTAAAREAPLVIEVFAGELEASRLRLLARLADQFASGVLLVTADQDVALMPAGPTERVALARVLDDEGVPVASPDQPGLRVCPGSQECRRGLVLTRDLAWRLQRQFAPCAASIAISGCPNGCSQPQLADFGILPVKLMQTADGQRRPRYDLIRRAGRELGRAIHSHLEEDQLFQWLAVYLGPASGPSTQGDTL